MTNRLFKGTPIGDLPALSGSLHDLILPASKNNITGRVTLQALIDLILSQIGSVSPSADIVPISGTTVDLDGGVNSYFTKQILSPITFSFVNPPPSGRAFTFTIELLTTVSDVTWPASVIWPGNQIPSFSDGKISLLTFTSRDGGTSWRGSARLNYGEGPPAGQESWDNGATWDGGAYWV